MDWQFKPTTLEGSLPQIHGYQRHAYVHYLQTRQINSPLVLQVTTELGKESLYIPCYANCGWPFVSDIIKQGGVKDTLEAAKIAAFFLYYNEAKENVPDQPDAKSES